MTACDFGPRAFGLRAFSLVPPVSGNAHVYSPAVIVFGPGDRHGAVVRDDGTTILGPGWRHRQPSAPRGAA